MDARATEMETRHARAAAEFALLTNRLAQARKEGTDAESGLRVSKGTLERTEADLAAAQKRLAEAQASQQQLAVEQAKVGAQVSASQKELEQARKESATTESRRDAAKAELQKADADLAAARAQLQVFVVKQGELTREIARLEVIAERLKKEKEALEKEIGRQEAQRQKAPAGGDK